MRKIVVTGGSGRLGQETIKTLEASGYRTLNLDRVPPREAQGDFRLADLCRSGDLYEAFKGAFGVVHLGAYQAPNMTADTETFNNNVTATYNVLKVAAESGVKKVAWASSTAAFGFIYALKTFLPEYLPLDENHPSKPQDPYGLSKVVGEQIADSIARLHPRMTICSLRFPGVVFDYSYSLVKQRWDDPGARTRTSWAYVDARDAANAFRLAMKAKFSGHEIIICAAPTSSMRESTDQLVKQFIGPRIRKKNGLRGNWSGVDSSKAKRLLGFKAEHVWEKYLTP